MAEDSATAGSGGGVVRNLLATNRLCAVYHAPNILSSHFDMRSDDHVADYDAEYPLGLLDEIARNGYCPL